MATNNSGASIRRQGHWTRNVALIGGLAIVEGVGGALAIPTSGLTELAAACVMLAVGIAGVITAWRLFTDPEADTDRYSLLVLLFWSVCVFDVVAFIVLATIEDQVLMWVLLVVVAMPLVSMAWLRAFKDFAHSNRKSTAG